ncbi:VanZ family protein [Paenibacillus sp. 32O-W]|uniref:VanZ family protein n=1 Tax=Paenibacillus sp. 32O-W TaxID=1695218 RepID=UPI0011A2367C|nr:VanZ family protein [Paenibacillus sp. 32O-W]
MRSNSGRIWLVLFYLLFAVYVCFAMKIILFKTIPLSKAFTHPLLELRSVNLIPLRTIIEFISEPMDLVMALTNILGNIAVFVPFGIFISYTVKKKSLGYQTLILFLTSLSIEIVQYILALGSTDVDDILLNVVGGLFGIAICQGMKRIFPAQDRHLIALVVFFLVAGIAGSATIMKVDSSLLPFGSSKVVYIDENKEIMEDLDEAAAHLVGELVSIDADTITVQRSPKHTVTMTQSEISNDGDERVTVSFNAVTKIIIRQIHSDKNEIISQYKEGTASELAFLLSSTDTVPSVRVWLSNEDNLSAHALLVSFIE